MKIVLQILLLILSAYYFWATIVILAFGDQSAVTTATTDIELRRISGLVLLPGLLLVFSAWKLEKAYIILLLVCVGFLVDAAGILISALQYNELPSSQLFEVAFKLSSPVLLLMRTLALEELKSKT